MRLETFHKSQGDHLVAVFRGASFAVCMGCALLFIWSWTLSPGGGSFLGGVKTVSVRAVEIANAPATLSQPWLPTALTNSAGAE